MKTSVIVVALSLCGAAQAQTLTIDEVVKIAEEHAFSVRSAMASQGKAADVYRATKGGLGPKVEVVGTYARLEQSAPITSFPDAFPSIAENKQIQAIASQSIDIAGLAKNVLNVARHQKLSAQARVRAERNLIRGLVRELCFQVLQTEELMGVQKAEVTAAEQRLEKTKIKFREDQVPKFDVLRLETDLRRSQQAYIKSRADHRLAIHRLNHAMGRDPDTALDLAQAEFKAQDGLSPVDLTIMALKSRAELDQQSETIKSLEQFKITETGGSKPSMKVQGVLTRTIDAVEGQRVSQFVASASITMPVWDAGVTKAKVKSAQRDIDLAEIGLEQLQLGIALDVRSALTRLENAAESLETAKTGEEFARESLRLAQLRFDEGVGILIDVTSAQAELTRARGSVATSRYDYLTAYAALQMAVGQDDLQGTAEMTTLTEEKVR
jgi:outer membrane protein TolC